MTTTILRPNATTQVGASSAVVGAGSIHAALSDNSDASYVTIGAWAGGTCIVELTTQALGANDVTKSITPRLRGSHAGSLASLYYVLYSGGSPIAGTAIVPALVPAATTFAGSAITVNLTSAQVAALQAYLLLSNPAASTLGRAYEAYADLVWVAGAVTTITYPTGAPVLAVSSITPTWTSVVDADADGGSRDRYRLKIFTAAQYGAGGFDPETSAAFYDSGDVVSTNQSQVVPALTNSTTFRTYVKVGDSVNGVAHWGAWQGGAGSQFSTSFTTANISTVVGTPSNANGRISVVVTRVTAGSPPLWETVEVQRSTNGGTSWLPVRAATNVAVSGSTFTVVDYEAPNGAVCSYRARATYTTGGQSVVGPWLVAAATATWTAVADWLKHPSHPSLNRKVTVAENPQRTRNRRQGIHSVIGRADPVVVSDVLNLTSGTITFLTATDQEAVDLLALLAYDQLFFQPRPGSRFGQKYIAIGSIDEVPETTLNNQPGTRWPIDWVEVLIPIDVGQT